MKYFYMLVLSMSLVGCFDTTAEISDNETTSSMNEKSIKLIKNGSEIDVNSQIVLEINNDYLNSSTVTSENLKIVKTSDSNSSETITGTLKILDDLQTIIFKPDYNFDENSNFQIIFSKNIQNYKGEHLEQDLIISFSTTSETDSTAPELVLKSIFENSTDVLNDKVIIFEFDEYIGANDENDILFVLTNSSTNETVSGDVVITSNMLKIFPSEPLEENQTYNLSVTFSLEDMAKNIVGKSLNYNFTTGENKFYSSDSQDDFSPKSEANLSSEIVEVSDYDLEIFTLKDELFIKDDEIRKLFLFDDIYYYLNDSDFMSINLNTTQISKSSVLEESESDNFIDIIYQDGVFKILTKSNLYSLNTSSEITTLKSFSYNVNGFIAYNESDLLIATEQGIFQMSSSLSYFSDYDFLKIKTFGDNIYGLYLDSENQYKISNLSLNSQNETNVINLGTETIKDFIPFSENSFFVATESNIRFVQHMSSEIYTQDIASLTSEVKNLFLKDKLLYFTTESDEIFNIDVSIPLSFHTASIFDENDLENIDGFYALTVGKATTENSNFLFGVDYLNGIYATKLNEDGSISDKVLNYKKEFIKNLLIDEDSQKLYLVTDEKLETVNLNIEFDENPWSLSKIEEFKFFEDAEQNYQLQLFDLAKKENFIYISTEKGIAVLNVDTNETSSLENKTMFYSLEIYENYLIATTLKNEVYIFDLESNYEYTKIETNNYSSRAIFVKNNYLFVGFQGGNIEVYNISDLENIGLISTLKTANSVSDILLKNGFLYIADNSAGLRVFQTNLNFDFNNELSLEDSEIYFDEFAVYKKGSNFGFASFLNKIYTSAKENGIFILNSL